MFLSDERLKMLDFTIHIGSTPTFLYFNLYLNTAYKTQRHYMFIISISNTITLGKLAREPFANPPEA